MTMLMHYWRGRILKFVHHALNTHLWSSNSSLSESTLCPAGCHCCWHPMPLDQPQTSTSVLPSCVMLAVLSYTHKYWNTYPRCLSRCPTYFNVGNAPWKSWLRKVIPSTKLRVNPPNMGNLFRFWGGGPNNKQRSCHFAYHSWHGGVLVLLQGETWKYAIVTPACPCSKTAETWMMLFELPQSVSRAPHSQNDANLAAKATLDRILAVI